MARRFQNKTVHCALVIALTPVIFAWCFGVHLFFFTAPAAVRESWREFTDFMEDVWNA